MLHRIPSGFNYFAASFITAHLSTFACPLLYSSFIRLSATFTMAQLSTSPYPSLLKSRLLWIFTLFSPHFTQPSLTLKDLDQSLLNKSSPELLLHILTFLYTALFGNGYKTMDNTACYQQRTTTPQGWHHLLLR